MESKLSESESSNDQEKNPFRFHAQKNMISPLSKMKSQRSGIFDDKNFRSLGRQ